MLPRAQHSFTGSKLSCKHVMLMSGFATKTEKLAPVASLVSIHHLRPRAGLVDPVSV